MGLSRKQRMAGLALPATARPLDPDNPGDGVPAVNGGFRTGKRHRGVSLLRKKPREVTRAYRFTITDDATGHVIADRAFMVSYRRDES